MRRTLIRIAMSLLGTAPVVAQGDPWPAETPAEATNLTSIEGGGSNDFHDDLSGASWNPLTRRLWVCRNGPGTNGSKLWAIVEDGTGGFEIDKRSGNRGEWTGFGDLEGVTQANLSEDVVYGMIEDDGTGGGRIVEYDVSVYGVQTVNNDWDTRAILPTTGADGAEGIAFVPDTFLAQAGFVDGDGNPYTSTQGMGGLMFVGHQVEGSVFAFDLNRSNSSFVLVGEYRGAFNEIAGLEFDRSTGTLYAWHDGSVDLLTEHDLTSFDVGQSFRGLLTTRIWKSPDPTQNLNIEGIALMETADCGSGGRSFFTTIDDGGPESLLQYQRFYPGCDCFLVYCDSNPDNSASICIDSNDCAASGIEVRMTGGPTGNLGYLMVGAGSASTTDPPGAVGDLCLMGQPIGRYVQDAGVISGGALGTDVLNATSGGGGGGLPTIGGNLCNPAGQTWNFQYWYRDGMQPSKFSQALSVTFR